MAEDLAMESRITASQKVSATLSIVELYEEAACDLLAQHPECLGAENPNREALATDLLGAVLAGQRERRMLREYLFGQSHLS